MYLMAEISDGDPGKDESSLQLTLNSEEGFVSFYEMGYHFGDEEESRTMPGMYKLGCWYHTAEFDDVKEFGCKWKSHCNTLIIMVSILLLTRCCFLDKGKNRTRSFFSGGCGT